MLKSTTIRAAIENAFAMGQSVTVRASQPFPRFGMRNVEVVAVGNRKVQLRDDEGREWWAAWGTVRAVVASR